MILIIFSAISGLLEGIGISMLFPILTSFSNKSPVVDSEVTVGIVHEIVKLTHIPLTQKNLVILFISAFVAKAVFKYLVGLYKSNLSSNMLKSIRFDFISGFVNLDYLHYTLLDSGKISNTFTLELEKTMTGFTYFCNYLVGLFTGLAFLSMVFLIDTKFTLIILAAGSIYYLSFSRINKSISSYSKKITFQNSGFNSLLIQLVQAFKYLKSTSSFSNIKRMLESNVDNIRKLKFEMDMRSILVVAIQEPIVLMIILGVVYINVILFNMSMNAIVIILLLFYRAINYLLTSQSVWNYFTSQIGSTESVIRLKNKLNSNIETGEGRGDSILNKSIELKSVNFSYGEKAILKNISLEFKKNQTIALIGRSGSGKSTLINLISGLLKPNNGEILIDQVPLGEIDIEKWRKKIGYITQETTIFNDTIENNITLWDEFQNQREFHYLDAIHKSQLTTLLQENDNGKKIIGERGVMLSGGQRQRIAIARELYKSPELLILDEATSALDSETENYIQKSIDELRGKITIIVVAHRLSTIRYADKVIVFDKGEIVESGSFAELASIPNSELNNFIALQSF